MKKLHLPARASRTQGIVLIDALVAILIFSVGIMGLVSLQGSAIDMTSASSYRINAAMLTDQVIAQMWATPDFTQLSTLFAGTAGKDGKGTGGTAYTSWFNTLDCTASAKLPNCLPGVNSNPPTIVVTPQTISSSGTVQYQVAVTLRWQAPSDSSAHTYVSTTAIGN
ncbi:hypothetical protein [Dyella sp.]|jgi:type IV pilus assembly protein PilV|uniref:type IV pilus modification PilV family protein n=1 Tax=Dyella sp. TaxID=1869338 RepID=UPI002FDB50AD